MEVVTLSCRGQNGEDTLPADNVSLSCLVFFVNCSLLSSRRIVPIIGPLVALGIGCPSMTSWQPTDSSRDRLKAANPPVATR